MSWLIIWLRRFSERGGLFYSITFILVIAGVSLIFIGGRITESIGIAVVATALISFIYDQIFLKRLTIRYLDILKSATESGIRMIYKDRETALPDIKKAINIAHSKIQLLGIALTDFVGQKWFEDSLESLKNIPITIQILMLDRFSEAAKVRAEREQPTIEPDRERKLFMDLRNAVEFFNFYRVQNSDKVAMTIEEPRYYSWSPMIFLVIVDESDMFVEQYHLGIETETTHAWPTCIGKNVPVFRLARGSKYFELMQSHYNYLWNQFDPKKKKQIP